MSTRFKPITQAKISWRDGLPYAEAFSDIYFSKENGLKESHAVFIEGNDLITRWQALPDSAPSTFVMGELGFGSGLNCLLAWQLFLKHAPTCARLEIFSVEKHPLSLSDLKRCLALWPELKHEAACLLEAYPILTPGMHTLSFENGRVVLHLMLGEATDALDTLLTCGEATLEREVRPWQVDAWFLDGFSPAKNSDMWCSELFKRMALLSGTHTTLATFSVASKVRAGLTEVGFQVEKKPGFGQKRARLQGTFSGHTSASLKKPYTPWHVGGVNKCQHAMIIGAGLAGCFTAHALVKRGWHVTVCDGAPEVAMGASGNTQAVLYPNFSAYRSPLTTWMLQAFLFASRTYYPWVKAQHIRGQLEGILQLAWQEKTHKLHTSLKAWLSAYPDLGVLVDEVAASDLAGASIEVPALFVPRAGWIDSKSLCYFLLDHPKIEFQPNTYVSSLEHKADAVVLANAGSVPQFLETAHLPLELIHGEMLAIKSNADTQKLKRPLCAAGHVLPNTAGVHWLGASYKKTPIETPEAHENLSKLKAMPVELPWSNDVKAHWMGVRAKTPDYLPLVGPVANARAFKARFAKLQEDKYWFMPKPGVYHPGLYVCAGFGSRGLTSIPLAAEHLASVIANGPACLPRTLVQSIAPARFLIKQLSQT